MPNIDIDLRVFRRYPREIDFILHANSKSFTAKTVDYSFNSLGIIIEGPADIKLDDIVDLDIDELGIHQRGKVLWVKRDAHRIRAGVAKIGKLKGNFIDYHLSDILIGFQRTLKAGVLDVRKGLIHKRVYIRNGNIIYATSDQDEDRIGDILLREGRMTREQYVYAAERKRSTNERYVVILVDAGFLKPADLLTTIELQATRIIESLFAFKDAAFEFLEGSLSSEPPVALRLSVANLIYREVKKTADVELLEKYLLDSIVDFSSTPLNLFQNIKLEKADRMLISRVDGKTTIRELIRLSPLEVKESLRTFFALFEARILVTKDLDEAPQGITSQEISEHTEKIYCERIDVIDEMYSKYLQLDYYRMLGIRRHATPDEIRKAYFKTARNFHPDMHLDLPGDIKQKLVNIFVRINNAYLTLKDHEKRLEYDMSLKFEANDVTPENVKTTGFSVTGDIPENNISGEGGFGAAVSNNSEIANTQYEEGKRYFRKDKIEEALHHFASAIYFDSSRPEYHYYYGYALEKLGRLKESIHALSRAFEMSPNNADILAEIGHVYLKLNCPLRAKGNFERALRLVAAHKRAQQGIELISPFSAVIS